MAGSDPKGVALVRDAVNNGHALEESGAGTLADVAHNAVSAAPSAT